MEHKQELKRNQMRRYLADSTAIVLDDADIVTARVWAAERGLYVERGKGAGENGSLRALFHQIAQARRHAPDVLDACLTAILADIPDA